MVITCYNLEKYIFTAIQSARMQDYSGIVQILVVDDCSSDGSAKIIGSIPGIQIISRSKNGGVMHATLDGINATSHDVIFFLDGDDIWDRAKISRSMKKMDRETVLVTHDLWYMDASGLKIDRISKVEKKLDNLPETLSGKIVREGILNHTDYVWLGSAFAIRKSRCDIRRFVEICSNEEDIEIIYQDWPLAIWICLYGRGDIKYVNEKLMGYRLHEENYSGTTQSIVKRIKNVRKAINTMRFIEKLIMLSDIENKAGEKNRFIRKNYELQYIALTGTRAEYLKEVYSMRVELLERGVAIKEIIRHIILLILGPSKAHDFIEKLKLWRAKK